MAPKKKQRKTAAPAPAAAPAVAARKEWEAEKLTGKRAQKGGKNGTVVYTYTRCSGRPGRVARIGQTHSSHPSASSAGSPR